MPHYLAMLQGRTVLITGATSGIGLEAAAVLAGMSANVIIVGRDAGRIEKALARIKERSGATAKAYQCDFSSLRQVNQLAEDVLRDVPALHVLINNAGSVFARRTVTADGFESTFAVNHLAPFLLTQRLLPLLTASAPARIIAVASGGHRQATMDFDDLGFARRYQIMRAYARSKLANVLFASELARRLAGTGVTSNSLTPGRVATNIWSGAPTWSKPIITLWLSRSFMPVAEGAAPVVALASKPELEKTTGQYFERFETVLPSSLARDNGVAARLWSESERLVEMARRDPASNTIVYFGAPGTRRELTLRARGERMVALFAGSTGTGKTLAAETLATDLGRRLHRVDLNAIVSKYIGETEKSIDRLFADAEREGAVLFFDEADAVFGRRTGVRDSHDRYANLEVSHLLGRIEAYNGLVILATNRRENLDDAIARRVRLFVEFPSLEAK
jgi:retinol dehydrogenase 14